MLFSGSIRYNLDPFGEHDDKRIWDVLDQVLFSLLIDIIIDFYSLFPTSGATKECS